MNQKINSNTLNFTYLLFYEISGQKKISPPKVKEERETKPISVKKKQPGRSSLLTGRGVTTQMLIDEQILDPGEKFLTINYLVSILFHSF